MLKAASFNDIDELVGIHKRAFRNLFSSKLGDDYLKLFYKSVITSRFSKCFVYTENDRVLGYIAGILNKNKLFSRRSEVLVICYIFRSLFLLKISLFEVFIFIRYLLWTNKFSIKSELLAFAVAKNSRGKGVGSSLLEALVDYYKDMNSEKFVVFSDDLISSAIDFYNKREFETIAKIKQSGYNIFCLCRKVRK